MGHGCEEGIGSANDEDGVIVGSSGVGSAGTAIHPMDGGGAGGASLFAIGPRPATWAAEPVSRQHSPSSATVARPTLSLSKLTAHVMGLSGFMCSLREPKSLTN